MNRARRSNAAKPFVSGGIYNPNTVQKPVIEEPAAAAAQEPFSPNANCVISVSSKDSPQVDVNSQMPRPIIVKEEPARDEVVQLDDDDKDSDDNAMDDNSVDTVEESSTTTTTKNGGKIPFKKIFQKRKKSSERTRDKKQRQNRQLRKSILPKNALMALNEVKGINISDFTINSNPDGGFTAIVTVNTNQYEGKGQSKMAAKNLACEKALRDYIIAKMSPRGKNKNKQNAEKVSPPSSTPSEAMDTNENADDEKEETEAETPDDDLPMLNLASFAIYKLFAEWERQGFVVPEMHPNAGAAIASQADPNAPAGALANSPPAAPKEAKKPAIRSELPPNWETMHPATLLCIMRPGIIYVETGSCGEKPNVMQNLSVTVDDQEFTGTGRSKKVARRNVAVNVCNTLFSTNFDEEH